MGGSSLWAGHDLKKLAGIGRQAIDVAPLPLGIDDVKGQGGFSRTAQTRNHNKPVTGYLETYTFQVVLLGAENRNRTVPVSPLGPSVPRAFL